MRRTLRVLHIDDDPDTRFLMQELAAEAEQPGEDVRIEWLGAADVDEALAQHAATDVHVVLLDNRLGGREGVDQIGRLRQTWQCPLWLVTGAPDWNLVERAVSSGAAGLMGKDDLMADGAGLRKAILQAMGAGAGGG